MPPITVAVDCNGADLGPAEVAAGAALAAEQGVRVLLFGPAARARRRRPAASRSSTRPSRSRRRADPALAVALDARRLDRAGRAGRRRGPRRRARLRRPTGAALAAGLFNIKRARGIYRPALALPLPVPGAPVTLLDVGANAEARREHLVQFASWARRSRRRVLGVERPRVGAAVQRRGAGARHAAA